MLNEHDAITNQQPSIAAVVGTFAAVPYIHLHLESWRRNYPSMPLLVNDDGSPHGPEIASLCQTYGADFVANPVRMRRTVGDMSAYIQGFEWARRNGIEIVVKFSRRFVPLHNWPGQLQSLARETEYATFSQQCRHFHFGFRTECIGFHVPTWYETGQVEFLSGFVEGNKPCFVEGTVHECARKIQKVVVERSSVNRAHVEAHPRPHDSNGYAIWEIMPDRRTTKRPNILWHDCDTPLDYCRAALQFGLDYEEKDFGDPNQGCGLGTP